MCGRYLLRHEPEFSTHNSWEEYWNDIDNFVPRYNIAPSQRAPLVIAGENGPRFVEMHWGFRPSWAKSSFTKINARSETVASSKMFRSSFRNQRCLVPADGFYEPKGESSQRYRPWHLFEYPNAQTFMMAGIWTEFNDGTHCQQNFCILTAAANQQVSSIHHRMPVILSESDWEVWLTSKDSQTLINVLQPKPYPGLVEYPVSDMAKNPAVDSADCIKPLSTSSSEEAKPDEATPGQNLSLF